MCPLAEDAQHSSTSGEHTGRRLLLDPVLYPQAAVSAAQQAFDGLCTFTAGAGMEFTVRPKPSASATAVDEFLNDALRRAAQIHVGPAFPALATVTGGPPLPPPRT